MRTYQPLEGVVFTLLLPSGVATLVACSSQPVAWQRGRCLLWTCNEILGGVSHVHCHWKQNSDVKPCLGLTATGAEQGAQPPLHHQQQHPKQDFTTAF